VTGETSVGQNRPNIAIKADAFGALGRDSMRCNEAQVYEPSYSYAKTRPSTMRRSISVQNHSFFPARQDAELGNAFISQIPQRVSRQLAL
jgi:hypothetical protein